MRTTDTHRSDVGRPLGAYFAACLLVLVALLAAGCGGSDEPEGGGANSSGAASADLGGKTIGVLSLCEACEGVHRMTVGMQDAAEAVGWKIRLVDGQGAPDKLLAGLNALVQERVDAIVLEAVEPAMVKGALDAAIEAKIPVVTQDVGHTTPGVLTDISPDEAANTALLNQEMLKLIGGGPAKIAAMSGFAVRISVVNFAASSAKFGATESCAWTISRSFSLASFSSCLKRSAVVLSDM